MKYGGDGFSQDDKSAVGIDVVATNLYSINWIPADDPIDGVVPLNGPATVSVVAPGVIVNELPCVFGV